MFMNTLAFTRRRAGDASHAKSLFVSPLDGAVASLADWQVFSKQFLTTALFPVVRFKVLL